MQVIHQESSTEGRYQGTFVVKRKIHTATVHFPTESTEEYHLRELRKMYFRTYGPLSKEIFDKILKMYATKFISSSGVTQNKMFQKLYLTQKIYHLLRGSFNLVLTSRTLFLSCYEAAERFLVDLRDESFRDALVYPNQAKMTLLKKSANRAVKRFVRRAVHYLKENPFVLFQLPVESIVAFLHKYNTRTLTVYGAWLSRVGWLHASIANVIAIEYVSYKESWQAFLVKYLYLPIDICKIMTEMICQHLRGETFVAFFTRICRPRVKYAQYVKYFDYHTTILQTNTFYDVVLYV
jgi:hypothetical protein